MSIKEMKTLTIGDSTYEIVDNEAVHYTAQALSKEQKTQIKENIGVYVQSEEPVDSVEGDIWVDVDAESHLDPEIVIDSTLTQSGKAADAKVVGDKISKINSDKADISYVDNEITLAKVDLSQLEANFASSIDNCVDTNKVYILPDNYIYAYLIGESAYPKIEIEFKENGYWDSSEKWRSVEEQHNLDCKRTNHIPVTAGDKFSYMGECGGAGGGAGAVLWLDANNNLLSRENYDARAQAVEVTAPEGAKYVWFESINYGGEVILEVNWILCQAATEYQWTNTGHSFVSADYEDRIIAVEEDVEVLEVASKQYEESISALEVDVATIKEAGYNGRISNLESTVEEIQGSAIIVNKPVSFEWFSNTAFASATVGNTIKENAVSGSTEYGYNFMPVKEGEVYNIKGRHAWGSFCWAFADINNITLSVSENTDTSDDVTDIEAELTVPSGAAYLYFNKYGFNYLTKKTAVSTALTDILTNKLIVYEGDSIAESRNDNGGGYAKIIADMTYGRYDNQAVSGGILRTRNGITTNSSHSVVDNLPNLPKDADLYCFEGGINDYWGQAVLGTYDKADYTSAVDATTVCGALETIFRYALNNFVGKPIVFIITHKIQGTAYGKNPVGNTFEEYHDAMVGICNKYSIPYYDAFNESGLNGWNETQAIQYLNGVSDACHPNEEGYKRYYVPQLLNLFRKVMPNM